MDFFFSRFSSTADSNDDFFIYDPNDLAIKEKLNLPDNLDKLSPSDGNEKTGRSDKDENSQPISTNIRKLLSSGNSKASENLSKIITDIPCTNATTYHIRELPYHVPPEIYKFSLSDRGAILMQRKDTWSSSKLSLQSIQSFQSLQSLPSFCSLQSKSTKNISPFLDYFKKRNMYPKVDFEPLKDVSFKNVFRSSENVETEDFDWKGKNLYIKDVVDIFGKSSKQCVLNRDVKWLWTLNVDCEFLFCPEIQINSSDTRDEVKHGDMVASQRHIGSVNHLIYGRGPARMGGELYFDKTHSRWCINNDSSYCFFRQDKRVLSNGRGFKWQDYINVLFQLIGIKTKDLIWIDRVQCRQLDGYIIQGVAFRFQRYRNKQIKQSALEQMSEQQKTDEYRIIKHFKDINIASLILGSFGVDTLFLTEGKLEVNIIRGTNIPSVSKFIDLEYPKRYCKIHLVGCEEIIQDKWWFKTEQTQSIPCPADKDIYWHSPQYLLYVTSKQIEVLVIDIFQEPEIKIGSCIIEVRDLIPGKKITSWFPVTLIQGALSNPNSKPQIGLSLKYTSTHSNPINQPPILTSTLHSSLQSTLYSSVQPSLYSTLASSLSNSEPSIQASIQSSTQSNSQSGIPMKQSSNFQFNTPSSIQSSMQSGTEC